MNLLFTLIGFGPLEITIVILVVLLLFGGRKIPELMRGIGQGMREFKKASRGEADNSTDEAIEDKTK